MTIEYRNNNRARLKVYMGRDLHGKMLYASKTITYKDKKDAKRQHDEFKIEVANGLVSTGEKITIKALGERVIETKKTRGLEATTLYGYQNDLNRIVKTLGNPQARKVSPLDVEQWIDDLVDKYSRKTVKNTVNLLAQIYKYGIRWRLVNNNPVDGVELPPEAGGTRRILNNDELLPFVQALRSHEQRDFMVAYELALFCGLRRSEILGLTLSDIDLDRHELTISNTRHRIGEEDLIQPPKTSKSHRTVAIPAFIVDDIKALKKEHIERQLADMFYDRNDYLIKAPTGEPLKPNRLTDELRRFTTAHDLPPVTTHGLRHTHASLVNYLGHDLTEISAQLGHSQHATTLNIYTHMFNKASTASRSIADDLNELVLENAL